MTDKKCTNCGERLSAKSTICPACGSSAEDKSKPAGRRVNDHFIIVVVLVMAVVAFLAYQAMVADKSEAGDPHRQAPTPMSAANMYDFVENLPTEFQPLVTMGNALMDQGNFAMAVECYSRAIDLQPDKPDVITDLGACQHALGKDAEAIAAFEKALDVDPRHPVAKFNLGIVYSNMGDSATARQWWEKLLAEDPPQELKMRIQSLLQ